MKNNQTVKIQDLFKLSAEGSYNCRMFEYKLLQN